MIGSATFLNSNNDHINIIPALNPQPGQAAVHRVVCSHRDIVPHANKPRTDKYLIS